MRKQSVWAIEKTASMVWNINYLGIAFVNAMVLNSCGESDWSTEKQTFGKNTVGMHNITSNTITIDPNPNNGVFYIKSDLWIFR